MKTPKVRQRNLKLAGSADSESRLLKSLGVSCGLFILAVWYHKPDRFNNLSVDLSLGQTKKKNTLELPTLPFRIVERYTGFDGKMYCQRLAHTRMGAW